MRYEIIRKADNHVHGWAGGSTAEIFAYPPGTCCADRNFELRVSSAVVELDNSPFSDFTGFVRHIMPIEGTMHLFHEGLRDVLLHPYEADTFDGALDTRSVGRCVDFNLIHRPIWQGRIEAITRPGVLPFAAGALTGIFARIDGLIIEGAGGNGQRFKAELQNGDFLALRPETTLPGTLTLSAPAADAGKVLGILAAAERIAAQ